MFVLCLGGVAWWLWDRPEAEDQGGAQVPKVVPEPRDPGAPDSSAPDPTPAGGAIEEIKALIEAEEFERADEALDRARERSAATPALQDLRASLSLRRQAHRTALRPIEFRVLSWSRDEDDDAGEVYARFSIDDVPIYETPILVQAFADAPDDQRRANVITLRTSIERGASIELLEPGGFFGGAESLFGPTTVAPLPDRTGGEVTLQDPDSEITSVVLQYAPSRYAPGLYPSESPEPVPPGASAGTLVGALTSALATDRLDVADELLVRLTAEYPSHPDTAFAEARIAERKDSLRRNRSRVRFTVLEAAVDPPEAGELWASGGSTPSFLGAIEVGDEEFEGEGELAPYLVPGLALDAPDGNVIEAIGRGDTPLRFKLYDTSPTFGRSDVGAVYLETTLGDFPAGTGTLVLEREPSVLLLPDRAENRLRRLVLRYAVER